MILAHFCSFESEVRRHTGPYAHTGSSRHGFVVRLVQHHLQERFDWLVVANPQPNAKVCMVLQRMVSNTKLTLTPVCMVLAK